MATVGRGDGSIMGWNSDGGSKFSGSSSRSDAWGAAMWVMNSSSSCSSSGGSMEKSGSSSSSSSSGGGDSATFPDLSFSKARMSDSEAVQMACGVTKE